MKISNLALLLIGMLLVLNAFYINRFISSHFEPSMITLDSLLISENADK